MPSGGAGVKPRRPSRLAENENTGQTLALHYRRGGAFELPRIVERLILMRILN
jgi:hypothetical protein